jgi:hypothetical protein
VWFLLYVSDGRHEVPLKMDAGFCEEQTRGLLELVADLSIADCADPLEVVFHGEMLPLLNNSRIDAEAGGGSMRLHRELDGNGCGASQQNEAQTDKC